ncbi:MAG: GTPase Era [Actinobacteria bacterium]|nr:GTPase Era [Actinomycetota bacterium]
MNEFRSGFVSFVGRPNVGKSTLTNALVGEKIAITSSKPQTTRRAIRGIVNTPAAQIIVVDTPGLHRPRTLLGQRLNDVVGNTLNSVDVIGFCVPANEKIGPGDAFINEQLSEYRRAKLIALVTKSETVSRDALAKQLVEISELRNWDAVIPVSAISGEQLDELKVILGELLPKSQALYPEDMKTEESLEERVCELIREASLEDSREELPHSLAVTIDEMGPREDSNIYDIHANLWVERDSQKAIVIGKGGSRLKQIGSEARVEIEKLLGTKVMLRIHVKVAPDWQRDPKQLGRLGM